MSSARRPLLTATAAGTLLCALWFVPSANATGGDSARDASSVTPASQVTTQARVARAATDSSGTDTQLADTGSFDTTPYVIGGTLFLGVGAGFVVYSVRRERLGF
ncbi:MULTISPECIES: LPXTG cell wall anchor domain-containing protein [Streptomyces]|uniref:LPXTG cell wall anchor domain-containing protein n=1 Tax=Streptomyces spinosisporus TaxID=2927582 RepID=A0ABS9XD17_9ACTN|nr:MULTISPECIES: LPXTG cell wall anchor domain-containing protein [Streptomyces]EPD60930.1 LPXTG-domain-containing protein cell wall anchor domain [Streptomyces sp. HGB0020]MCI3239497.1 LPXTG cell wall anchor domain-containing protein [Streptomyces spinosisporus]WUB37961.1 LPXTG cell wall anchor domain-containing protein [Streptomyces sp. NBC_00588]